MSSVSRGTLNRDLGRMYERVSNARHRCACQKCSGRVMAGEISPRPLLLRPCSAGGELPSQLRATQVLADASACVCRAH